MNMSQVLIAAVLMTVFSKAPLAFAQKSTGGGYDNRNPRAQQASLTGWGARSAAAHANGWEALPIFLAGGVLSVATGHDDTTSVAIGWGWVLSRALYTALYVMDKDKLRSTVWAVSLGLSLSLFFRAAV